MLPFDVAGDANWFECDGMRLPRYGSLTVGEALTMGRLLNQELQDLLTNPLMGPEASYHLRSAIAAVALISRYDASMDLATIGALSIPVIVAISDFLLSEQTATQDTAEPDADATPTDWPLLWWQLQRHYPHEPRFSRERFSNCPIVLVRQAIKSLQQERLERLNEEAVTPSLLGVYGLRMHDIKAASEEWFNPWRRILDRRAAKSEVPIESARLFLQLTAEQKIPSWVVNVVDVEKLRLAAGD